jgi:hypothetical protein
MNESDYSEHSSIRAYHQGWGDALHGHSMPKDLCEAYPSATDRVAYIDGYRDCITKQRDAFASGKL